MLSPTAHARFESRSAVTRHHSPEGVTAHARGRGRASARSQYRSQYNSASGPGSMAFPSRATCPSWSTWWFLAALTDPHAQDRVGSTSQPPTARRPLSPLRERIDSASVLRIPTGAVAKTSDSPHWPRGPCAGPPVDMAAAKGASWRHRSATCRSHSQRRPKSKSDRLEPRGNNPSRHRMPVFRHGLWPSRAPKQNANMLRGRKRNCIRPITVEQRSQDPETLHRVTVRRDNPRFAPGSPPTRAGLSLRLACESASRLNLPRTPP